MLINPDIEAWFEKLQGRRLGAGGSAPRGQGLPNYGSSAIQGIVQPGRGMFGFTAPQIRSNYRPTPIAPNPGLQSPGQQVVPFQGISGGGRDLGGGAKAAGLQKLGSGIESALKQFGENRKEWEAIHGYTPMGAVTNGPLSRQMARNPGATMPPGAATAPPAAAVPETFPPVGANSETPVIAQLGGEARGPVPPIGAAGASLPTFAQNAPGDQMAKYAEAIASIESRGSGDYAAVGPVTRTGDHAYGRYQVMGNNVPAWTKAATGTAMTPQQFLADKGAQEAVFKQQFGQAVNQYGPQGAANWWFTGKSNPPATANDRYTSAPEYLRKFNASLAAQGGMAPPLTAPSASAFAANPPSLTEPTAPQFAGPGAAPAPGSQNVIPGQTDPHRPGFDPNSVPFHRTPEMGPAPSIANPAGPDEIQMNLKPPRGFDAPPQGGPVTVPVPPPGGVEPGPTQISPGQPQTGPAYSDQTWNNRPQFDYSAPATGAANVPVPPPRPADSGQPPILNGGQPGVYDMPGQSGMINMPTPQDQLASALANGAPDVTPQLDQSAMLSMALAQPDFVATPPPIDFGGGGFGGGFDFGGMFG